jgi:hypothetical protein
MREFIEQTELKQRVTHSSYEVDTRRVAAAIIAKLALSEDALSPLPIAGGPSPSGPSRRHLRPAA